MKFTLVCVAVGLISVVVSKVLLIYWSDSSGFAYTEKKKEKEINK
jgi:hypothetical protein